MELTRIQEVPKNLWVVKYRYKQQQKKTFNKNINIEVYRSTESERSQVIILFCCF